MTTLDRRAFFKLAAATAAVGVQAGGARAASAPNVVIIYTDDLDFRNLSYYGGGLTPNIDSIADDGMALENYYATSSVCTPSRYSLLTGNYPTRSANLRSRYPLGGPANVLWNTSFYRQEVLISDLFRAAGYTTGLVGKWHLGHGGNIHSFSGDADPADPVIQRALAENYAAAQTFLRDSFGFDSVESLYVRNVLGIGLPDALEFHNQEWITQGAVRFIEENNAAPFLLYLATTLPHSPYPPSSLRADPRVTPLGYLDSAPRVQEPRDTIEPRLAAAGVSGAEPQGLLWLDDGIGAILDALKANGVYDDTVIVFASDHQLRGKLTCYESCHAPCFIKFPSDFGGPAELDDLIGNIDITPTLLELCGIEPPADLSFDGSSFLGLLTGDLSSWRDSLLLQMGYGRAVVTSDRFKYIAIRYPEGVAEGNPNDYDITGERREPRYGALDDFPNYHDPDQLYDLDADPSEQNNLIVSGRHSARLTELKDELSALLEPLGHTFGEFTGGEERMDEVTAVDAPTTIGPAGTVSTSVRFVLSESRDLQLSLKARDRSWWGGRVVARGLRPEQRNVDIAFPLRHSPPSGRELVWTARLVPLGGDWPDTVAYRERDGVYVANADEITRIGAPLSVPATGTIPVSVGLNVSSEADVLFSLKSETPGAWWGGRVRARNVSPGTTDVNLNFVLRNNPPVGIPLVWTAWIVPPGGDWVDYRAFETLGRVSVRG